MKNGRSAKLLNTSLGLVIALGLLIAVVEILVHGVLISFDVADVYPEFVDAFLLSIILSPVLYFLVFRTIRDSEERFRRINATAQEAIVIVDEQGRLTDWNLAAQRIFQYSREEAVGQQVHRLIAPPSYHAAAARGFARFEETGEGPLIGKTIEIFALRKDGNEFPVELSISAVKLKGRWHAMGIIRDITEREQAEESLRESEDKFRNIVERSFDAVHMLDREGRFTYSSPAVELISGYRADEVIGIHFKEFLFDEDIPKASDAFDEMISGGAVRGLVLRAKKKDGTLLFLEINGSRILKGEKVTGVQLVYRDITERKEAESQLRNSEQRYRQIVQTSMDGFVITDTKGRFLDVNDANCQLIGYAREELLNMGIPDLEAQETPEETTQHIQEIMTKGHDRFETRHRRKDGQLLDIEVSAIYSSDKKDGRLFVFLRDITERKQTEQTKQEAGIRLKDALEDAIGAIAATLEQRDPYTAGHQRRVAQLAVAIGEEMGLAREVIEGIHFGGLIHDIGKISVPAEILGKPGHITDIELSLIKIHAEAGYEIVKNITFPWPVADMVRQHHERLDGSGYPQGLKDGEIILEARILAVADVVEAMLANRPYRAGLGMDAALGEIARTRATQLDPVAVDACLRVIREKGFAFTK